MFEHVRWRYPSLFIARQNISQNRLRSVLTVLGITVGVLAVASLGIFGNSLQVQVDQTLGDAESTVVVSPDRANGYESIRSRDISRIRRVSPSDRVTPVFVERQQISYRGKNSIVTTVGIQNPRRVYSSSLPETLRGEALVGANLAEEMDIDEGDTITVDNKTYRVYRVLESQPTAVVNPDNAIVLSPSAIESSNASNVIIKANSIDQANNTATTIRSQINYREDKVKVIELSDQIKRVKSTYDAIRTFLLAIAAISLLVAGIGILNTMWMSVVERREEIGVFRAIGLNRIDVLKIVVIEATLLGVLGSFFGTFLSIISGMVLNYILIGDAMITFYPANLWYLLFGLGTGVTVAFLSSLYPAFRAADDRPVDSLRS